MMARSSPRYLAVIGAGKCDGKTMEIARAVGAGVAEAGCILLTGGLGGVMEAASRGAAEKGGLVVGVLPGSSPDEANPYVHVAIATGMGDGRNVIIANTAAVFIAIGGSHGTLSEIAYALKRGKRVVGLGTWEVDPAILPASGPTEALRLALT